MELVDAETGGRWCLARVGTAGLGRAGGLFQKREESSEL